MTDMHWAIVTGAANGIGRATARQVAKAGYAVALIDVDAEGLSRIAAEIEAAGGTAKVFAGSVADADLRAEVFGFLQESGARLDVLVNVAGIGPKQKLPVEDIGLEGSMNVFDVNMFAPFQLIQAAVPLMKRQRYGRIVNVASTSAINPSAPGNTLYAMTKGAIAALTRQLIMEVSAHGITCNAIAPGFILTPLIEKRFALAEDRETAISRVLHHIPVGRMGQPEDIAHVVDFLIKPESSFLTGQMIVCDGGMTVVTNVSDVPFAKPAA